MDYKKILEGVVDIINTAEKSDIGFANICTYIGKNCPELKESEDERIRKALIRFHKSTIDVDGIKGEDILAWLEKQSEPVEINLTEFDTRLQTLIGKFDSLPKEELIGSLSFWLNVVQNNGTYKPAKKQGEQKPAEWSEEDEKAINDIMWIIEAYRKNGFNETHIQIADSSENWLKHLKERVFTQPKQE